MISTPKRLVINSKSSKVFISFDDIIYCKADGPYSIITLSNGQNHQVCKTLKKIEEHLKETTLFRANRQYLVNLLHIEKCTRNRNYKIQLDCGDMICVSVRNVTSLNKKIKDHFIVV